jgi:glucose/arabinose dehydrogenase
MAVIRATICALCGNALAVFLALAALLAGAAEARAQISARVYASGFAAPVAFVQDPVDRTLQYVVEQGGRIRLVRSGTVLATDFLNLTPFVRSGGEQGLLGLAFAPDFAASGRLYVNFTNTSGDTVVARFRRASDGLVVDPSTRFDLRWAGVGAPAVIPQPFANHNGGHLAFGPDGYLYIGLGDGGSADDPQHRAQNPSELLGKMLRVDVNVPLTQATGYTVPSDNPFIGRGPANTRPEIWSFGLRNPWRYSFDDPARGGTGALVIADVGQNQWEEVNYEPQGRGGRNYGWRNREGAHSHVTSQPPAFTPLTDPIHEYSHATGQSITGGFVYRGSALPAAFRGRYFFADYVSARVWSAALTINVSGEAQASDVRDHTAELSASGPLGNISSFGVDSDGELYLVSLSRGAIHKIVPATAAPPPPSNLRIIRP